MSFLIDATRHNFLSGSEDRLTQVVVAAFNANLRFRRIFFSFLKIKYQPKVRAFSQVHEVGSRPDIRLIGGKQWTKHIALIESKTESRSGQTQLNNHQSSSAMHYILVLKYREPLRGKRGWKVVYWSDLALMVKQEVVRMTDHGSFDSILFRSLVDFFQEYGFMKNSVISKGHLDGAGSFLNLVRFEKDPRGSLRGITDLQEITETMELALEMLKVDDDFARHLTEISAIRPSTTMGFSYRYEDIEALKGKKQRVRKLTMGLDSRSRKFLLSEAAELAEHRRHRANTLSLEKLIFLKRKKRNGIKSLSLSVEQVDDSKKQVIIQLSVRNSSGRICACRDWRRNSLPKGGLTAATIAKIAAREWSKWLKKKSIEW